jgi:hypothetical protein
MAIPLKDQADTWMIVVFDKSFFISRGGQLFPDARKCFDHETDVCR